MLGLLSRTSVCDPSLGCCFVSNLSQNTCNVITNDVYFFKSKVQILLKFCKFYSSISIGCAIGQNRKSKANFGSHKCLTKTSPKNTYKKDMFM